MKKVKLKLKGGNGTSEKDVVNFEKKYNISLPEDYRNFLLTYNGAEPEKNLFTYQTLLGGKDNFEIWSFYSCEDLFLDNHEGFTNNILPIANTNSGEVLISISGDNKGKIYFLEDGLQNEEINDYSNLCFLTNSFEDFLNSFDYPYDSKFVEYCEKGKIKEARKLIEQGLDVNSIHDITSRPIIYSVIDSLSLPINYNEVYELTKLMLEKGANITVGLLTQVSAFGEKGLNIVRLLVENGADINELGFSRPVIFASKAPSFEVVEYLLSKGADPDLKDSKGLSAIENIEESLKCEAYPPNYIYKLQQIYDLLLKYSNKQ